MENTAIQIAGTKDVQPVFRYLERFINYRLERELKDGTVEFPEFDNTYNKSQIANFIRKNELEESDIVLLLLALIPHISPWFLSDIVSQYLPNGGDFPEFGGIKGNNHRGILPTGETAIYILAGGQIDRRMDFTKWIAHESVLFRKGILMLQSVPKGEPLLSGRLILDEEYVSVLTTGIVQKPRLSPSFPASLVKTGMEWDDLVLAPKTISEIKEIETWLKFNEVLIKQWGMDKKIKPGYRVVFYGPPGTGKTLTAALLGKYTGRDVYRIDLSMVVSKYIGETEKNLSNLFNKAVNKDWILFFDESDAIFGKRTNIKDAHDKHANQEVSYLLQRIESHPGLVILATNFKSNMDMAFTRRFQSLIAFDFPTYKERLRLWQNSLPGNIPLESSISLEDLAKKFSLTGSNIINIIQYVGLKTFENGYKNVKESLLKEGIRKEYLKEGKSFDF